MVPRLRIVGWATWDNASASSGWTSVTPITPLTEPGYAVPSGPRIEGDPSAAGGYVEVWSEVTDDGVGFELAMVSAANRVQVRGRISWA